MVQSSQRQFYAIALADESESTELRRYGLESAEQDGTLAAVGSVYSPENDAVHDGISRPGLRLVSFGPLLKHRLFPLPEILSLLLDIGRQGTSTPVEIEFAVAFHVPAGAPKEFGFLQLRPLALSREMSELNLDDVAAASVVCKSSCVLGHGRVDDLYDAVVVDFHRFDRLGSTEVAQIVSRFNVKLVAQGRPYVLFGVGRWGSADPHLGIPVTWDQIAGARVIVETGFRDFQVTPSQGTHFFQNLTSSNVGYFTVNSDEAGELVDWDFLLRQPATAEAGCVRHLRFAHPMIVKMNGRENRGVILKPDGTS
jgi:hypothetical protein